jgi:long-chain fatty acid transport protein
MEMMRAMNTPPLPPAAPCRPRTDVDLPRTLTHLGWMGLGCALLAHGEGFRNPPAGAFNLGRAGGRFTQVDDSSAVAQNPANLTDLEQAQAQLTPSIVYLSVDYSGAGSAADHTENPWHLLPNLFASVPIKDGQYAFGLGVTTPYGLATEWEQSSGSPFRYAAPYRSELVTLNVNPSFALRLHERLTVGIGFDAMWSQLDLRQFYPWMIFPGSTGTEAEGRMQALGEGWGFGGNLGLTWEFLDNQRVAITYRSPMQIDYDGDFTINNLTPTASFLGATPSSHFSSEIKFPTIVGLGYGVRLSDRVRIEVSGEWLQFSNFQTLGIDAGNNNFLLTGSTQPAEIRQDWKNTFTAGIGFDWQMSDAFVLRGGYQFYQSPVPDGTFSPTIPDANQNVITVGVGWHYKRHSLEVAYGFDIYDQRRITNDQTPAFNGTYDITVHLISLAYRFNF